MALESWLYGDPETVAIRREQDRINRDKQCGACCYKIEKMRGIELVPACLYKRRIYGIRCELFKISVRWEELCR